MDRVVENLNSMGLEQLLLALVFLASYAAALGKLTGTRGRLYALGCAVLAAGGFVWMGRSWEGSVVLVAFAAVGVGLAAGVAWLLWLAATWHAPRLEPVRFEPSELSHADMVDTTFAHSEIGAASAEPALVSRLRSRWRIGWAKG